MTVFITQIDFNILNAIQSIRNPFLDTIMPLITFLGSGGIVWAVTALIMLCFKKSRKTGIINRYYNNSFTAFGIIPFYNGA